LCCPAEICVRQLPAAFEACLLQALAHPPTLPPHLPLNPPGACTNHTHTAAINRLDGRQYAVKKIPLDAHSAGAYARIMREVTTLSRLQHINVVRYFQVGGCAVLWCAVSRSEVAVVDAAGGWQLRQ
jgi:serine/threonine protein kinase